MMRWEQVGATGWQCADWRIGLCLVAGERHYVLWRADERVAEFVSLSAAQARADQIELAGPG